MSVVVTSAIALALALWAVSIYSRLVRLKQQVRTAWSRVESELTRRRDLASSVVDQVRNTAGVEPAALEALIATRDDAARARGPRAQAAKDAQLRHAIQRVLAPARSASGASFGQQVHELVARADAIDDAVGVAAASYKQVAATYNTAIGVFPNTIVAALGSFPRAEPFESSI